MVKSPKWKSLDLLEIPASSHSHFCKPTLQKPWSKQFHFDDFACPGRANYSAPNKPSYRYMSLSLPVVDSVWLTLCSCINGESLRVTIVLVFLLALFLPFISGLPAACMAAASIVLPFWPSWCFCWASCKSLKRTKGLAWALMKNLYIYNYMMVCGLYIAQFKFFI